MNKTNETLQVKANQKTPFVDVFMRGAVKGWNMAIKNMFPAVILAYTFINVLEKTGALEILQKVFDPIMIIFGMPGAAIAVIVTGMMTRPGGMATALALLSSGVLTERDVTILVIPIMIIGGCLGQYVRVIVASGAANKSHKYILLISGVMTFVSLWLMNLLLMLMGI